MPPKQPSNWPARFTEHLNAGDLDAAAALYDADARFVAPTGETVVGRERIREVLARLIRAKTQFRSRVVRATVVADVAILYTDFDGTTLDPAGLAVDIHSRAIEVLRRQPDGTWTLVIGDPNARAS